MSTVAAFPARPKRVEVNLDLLDARRRLVIRLDVGESVWVAVYPPAESALHADPLASTVGRRHAKDMEQFSLRYDVDGIFSLSLWVDTGCFPVSEIEAQQIADTYREHGLEIHRDVVAS